VKGGEPGGAGVPRLTGGTGSREGREGREGRKVRIAGPEGARTLCFLRAPVIWLRSRPRGVFSTSCLRSSNQVSSSSQLCRNSARCRVCSSSARLGSRKSHQGLQELLGMGKGLPTRVMQCLLGLFPE
jgi:hypothetical protein